ncbi:MAG: hypothetical protein JW944_12405 [Deltaproteobacteria bacterium]|nr:hypothetical protein [Deltaproteobacteria bacterium]
MRCDRCGAIIVDGEERELNGQILCEDCYMDLVSPLKACDPWAVYSAKSFSRSQGDNLSLTPVQEKILDILKNGPIEPEALSDRLKIKATDLEREFAVLRHMEKIRGELKDGKRFIRLW